MEIANELIEEIIRQGSNVAVQMICLGGKTVCKSCEDREKFLELLDKLKQLYGKEK